jgi:hypothetical protein
MTLARGSGMPFLLNLPLLALARAITWRRRRADTAPRTGLIGAAGGCALRPGARRYE